MQNRYQTTTGFRDLLFNLIIGITAMFFIALIMMNPPVKQHDAPKKAELLIIIEWTKDFNDDIDLWVLAPGDVKLWYGNKQTGLLNLERDDLGFSTETIASQSGRKNDVLPINREVAVIRGPIVGTFQVAAHVYNRQGDSRVLTGRITVSVVKLNPYKEMYVNHYTYDRQSQQITLVNFDLDKDSVASNFNNYPNNVITTIKPQ